MPFGKRAVGRMANQIIFKIERPQKNALIKKAKRLIARRDDKEISALMAIVNEGRLKGGQKEAELSDIVQALKLLIAKWEGKRRKFSEAETARIEEIEDALHNLSPERRQLFLPLLDGEHKK